MLRRKLLLWCVLVALVGWAVGPPPRRPQPKVEAGDTNKELKSEESESNENDPMEDIAKLEYDRYLKEVVNTLETDDQFRKKLEEASVDEIKTGDIAQHLEFVSHGVRSKLDELKRQEMDRVRQLIRLRMQQAQKDNLGRGGMLGSAASLAAGMKILEQQKMLAHLDHSNPANFGVDDLSKLIKQASKDLEDIDKKRRDEFKQYEMEKEHLRREKLRQMDERKRAEEQQEWEEKMKQRRNHPKINHPGGKDQLEEVWSEGDGFDKDNFDPKTFFRYHDTNGNGVLEHYEIEALFNRELDKLYKEDGSQESKMKRYEEMNRMREHVVNEVDTDKDGLISLEEFLESTKSEDFDQDEDWEDLDDQELFTDEEMDEFEKAYEERMRQRNFGGHAQPGEINVPVGRPGSLPPDLNVPHPDVDDVQKMRLPDDIAQQRMREEQMRQAAQAAQAQPGPVEQAHPVEQEGRPVEHVETQGQAQQVQQAHDPAVQQGQPVQHDGQPIHQEGQAVQQQDQVGHQQGQPVQQQGDSVQGQGQPVQQQGEPVQ